MRYASRTLLAFLLLAGPGCGRSHELEQGVYVFSVPPQDVIRDDCGLAADGGPLLQAQFQSYGDDIRFALQQQSNAQCLAVELVGQYQYNNENFFADGTASNPLLATNSALCQVDFVQFHLDGATVNASTFTGVMRISYLGSSPLACNCQFWFNFQATLCTAPACPPVPTQCS